MSRYVSGQWSPEEVRKYLQLEAIRRNLPMVHTHQCECMEKHHEWKHTKRRCWLNSVADCQRHRRMRRVAESVAYTMTYDPDEIPF